ncbi:MAG: hypothetical protein RJB39_125 [Candidatus Parcubacteria bacterium]|jgi:arabinose-5-phosphate isomerase
MVGMTPFSQNAKNTLEANLSAIKKIQLSDAKDFNLNIKAIQKRKGKIITTGVGKSSYVAMKMAATLSSLGVLSFFIHPVEAMHGDSGMIEKGDVIIAFSYSGESEEIIRFLQHEKQTKKVSIFSITKQVASSLGRISSGVFAVNIDKEGSPLNIAPMASVTASLVMADMIAAELVATDFTEKHFANFHPGGLLGLRYVSVKARMVSGPRLPLISQNNFKAAIREISDKKKGVVVITDQKNNLKGIITDGDIRRIVRKKEKMSEVDLFAEMGKAPKTIGEDESLQVALERMEEFKITTLVVLSKKGKVSGIIHIHDILDKKYL